MECELQAEEQELGHYQLRRLLGEGGFGQVYEAWDSKLHRSIAIKRLKPQLLSSRPDNLLDEARLAASLRHPAFVKIFSIDGDAEQQSIIMEYVDGSTLRQLVQAQGLPEAKALDIIAQVADAMSEAHSSKLIHGDIKPANLMLEASGKVRIMDFGLARKIDSQATESVVIDETQGTIAYLAPELMLGVQPSEQSDIYALGVVMYEMLTGARPFAHLSGLALAAAHLQSSSDLWVFPSHTSPQVAALVRAMSARNVEKRLRSMVEVTAAIGALRGEVAGKGGAPFPARQGGWLARLRRRPVAFGLAAALLLFSGLGAIAYANGWFSGRSVYISEAVAMQTGLAALKTFDREESLEVAIDNFNAILERNPDHAAAAAGLAFAYVFRHAGDRRDATWLQRADASAQLAMKSNDQLAMAFAAQGSVRGAQGKPDVALSLAAQALRLDPNNLFGLIVQGDVLTKTKRFAEAEKTLLQAIKLYPQEQVFQDLFGTVRYQQGDYHAAEESFRRSILIEPNAVIAYANLSHVILRQGRDDEALRVLQQGLQVRPSGQLYSNLGTALYNRGDYVNAVQAFERAVYSSRGGSNNYLRWANLADTLRWLPGRNNESQKAYQEAIKLMKPQLEMKPVDMTLLSRFGLYTARVGDHETAIELTRQALKLGPENADIHYRAAMTFEISGARAEAIAELTKARERGYPANLISAEPDLLALRRDPQYIKSNIERKE